MDLDILTWEQVKPIWDNHLWPGRDSEPVTSMQYKGGYDLSFKLEEPRFIGIVDTSDIIAVNSYVLTSGTMWRSRGLWVHPRFRGCGYARDLLQFMIKDIATTDGSMIWTMPRRGALEAYESVGFERTTDWEKQGWGVNCYARYDIR